MYSIVRYPDLVNRLIADKNVALQCSFYEKIEWMVDKRIEKLTLMFSA